MKKIFTNFAAKGVAATALAFLLVAPFAPLTARAQTAQDLTQQQLTQTSFTNGNFTNAPAASAGNVGLTQTGVSGTDATPISTGGTINDNVNPGSTAAVGQSSVAASAPQNQTNPYVQTSTADCALTSTNGVALCLSGVVYAFTVGIGTGFAYVAAIFFDFAVQLSLNGTAYALTFVSTGWTTARDLANMAFLFILIYIAFTVMFEAETSGTLQLLAWVVFMALLVNFSFFFTRLVIDAGNILAIQFYNAIQAPSIAQTILGGGQATLNNGVPSAVASGVNGAASALGATGWANSKDLTAGIMNMLQLQNLFNSTSFQYFASSQGFWVLLITTSFIYIAAGIMLWLLSVMLVTNGVKFLMRIVVLWFLIIASPLAFVARAVPNESIRGYYKQWQDLLIRHAFYPVAFLFIFLILNNFTTTLGQGGLIGDIFGGIPTGTPTVAALGSAIANVAVRMGFVIAILYIALEASNKIGVMGAKAAESAGNWFGGKYISTASGSFGALARNTVGLGAYRLRTTQTLRNLESKPGLVGMIGRGARAGLGSVGRTSFDARGTPGLSSVLGKEAGKAQKGGYEKAAEERVKEKEKKLKSVEPSDGQKERAQIKAKDETGYDKHEKTFNEESAKVSNADARLRQLIENGKEGSEEAKNAGAEKAAHTAQMNSAKRRMENLEPIMKQRAKELSGEDLSKKYADTLSTPNLRNLGFPFITSKDAAAKIRKGETEVEKIAKAVNKAAKEDKEKETPKSDEH